MNYFYGSVMRELIDSLQQFMYLHRPSKNTGDLSVGERMVMMTLNKHQATFHKGMLPSQLSTAMGLSRSAVTPLLNGLEAKNYLTRTVNPENRREILIQPNPQKPNLHEFRQHTFEKLIEILTPQEQRDLLVLINRLNDATLDQKGQTL